MPDPITFVVPEDGAADIIVVQRPDGTKIGGLRVDAAGRFVLSGPSMTNDITIDSSGNVCIGTAPATIDRKLRVAGTAQVETALRIGTDSLYGSAALSTVGTIQMARQKVSGGQVLSMIQMFRLNSGVSTECGRMGIDDDGFFSIMKGATDLPQVIFRSDSDRFYMVGTKSDGTRLKTEFGNSSGQLYGQSPNTGRTSYFVPD